MLSLIAKIKKICKDEGLDHGKKYFGDAEEKQGKDEFMQAMNKMQEKNMEFMQNMMLLSPFLTTVFQGLGVRGCRGHPFKAPKQAAAQRALTLSAFNSWISFEIASSRARASLYLHSGGN